MKSVSMQGELNGRLSAVGSMKRTERIVLSKLLLFTMLVAGVTAAHALTPAGPKRPATVPEDYVVTPFGYFHPSCVRQLGQGDVLHEDEGTVHHADGSIQEIQECAYPHYHSDGEEAREEGSAAATLPYIGHSWIEYGSVTTSSSYGEIAATWTVPPAPSANDGQVVYLFPGMEDYKDVVSIVQPVLGWNADFAGDWGIASWNCCAKGVTWESTPVKVKAGDSIFGAVYDTCAAGTLSCPTWNILTDDLTSGHVTELTKSSSVGQTFNWAFGGALEVYYISKCADYPSNGSISFKSIGLYNDKFVNIASPGWTISNVSAGLTPQCSYGGSVVSASDVKLTY
jgi:hypothetical protein